MVVEADMSGLIEGRARRSEGGALQPGAILHGVQRGV
jgi:hypothetical protein